MRIQWKSIVTVAALALFMGIAAPAWSGLADPMAEDYAVHVIPFYKLDANWSAFLVIADTSYEDLSHKGSSVNLRFFDAACNLKQDAIVVLTEEDAQFFALNSIDDANGQWNGIPKEGVILLDGLGNRILTYILLVNGNNNSLIRIDSIPCKGYNGVCYRGAKDGTWLRYDRTNTVAATFGDTDTFHTNLYFFSATSDLKSALLDYGTPHSGTSWAKTIHLDADCDEGYLGSRFLSLKCTQRMPLSALNYTLLNTFPDQRCAGKPGHIVATSSDNGVDPAKDYVDFSGFQETIASLVPPTNLIGTGYYHHSDNYDAIDVAE